MAKISVIIPVFAVEKYIERCLDSVCSQTLKDIEIIVINDCSPDNSDRIVRKFMEKDRHIKYITHESNMGLGGARNTGISAANAEYQWHIDGDDYIDLQACAFLYETASAVNVDVLTFSGVNVSEKGAYYNNYFARNRDLCGRVMNGEEFLRLARSANVFYCAVWLNLYRSSFLKDFSKKFRFRLNCAHQDTDYSPILYANASSVFCIHYAPYFRLVRADSTTGSAETLKKMMDKFAVTRSLLSYIESNNVPFGHPLSEFAFRDYNYFVSLFNKNFPEPNEEFVSIFNDLNSRFAKLKRGSTA